MLPVFSRHHADETPREFRLGGLSVFVLGSRKAGWYAVVRMEMTAEQHLPRCRVTIPVVRHHLVIPIIPIEVAETVWPKPLRADKSEMSCLTASDRHSCFSFCRGKKNLLHRPSRFGETSQR